MAGGFGGTIVAKLPLFRCLRRDTISRQVKNAMAVAAANIKSQIQSSDACCEVIGAVCGTSCTDVVCCSLPLPVAPVAVVEGDDELLPMAVGDGDDELLPVVVDGSAE